MAPSLFLSVFFKALSSQTASKIRSRKKARRCCATPCLLVPVVGVEPTRYRYHWILSPARLPIPSYRQAKSIIPYLFPKIKHFFCFFKTFFNDAQFVVKKDILSNLQFLGRQKCLSGKHTKRINVIGVNF